MYMYLVYCTGLHLPCGSFYIVAVVAISLDRTAYSIFENEQVVTVTLRLNDTYRQDIEVNVAVDELQGECTRELSCANSGGK